MTTAPGLHPDLRTTLERLGTRVISRRGERLFEQGRPASGIYLILTGHIALVVEQGRKRACTQIARPGDCIGLPAVMASNGFSVTAQVVDDADLIFISRDKVVNTLSHSPELCMQALDLLAREVQDMRRVLGAAKYAVH